MRIDFKPWRKFSAFHNIANVRRFIQDAADSAAETLEKGIRSPPKTGRYYGSHRASAPGEYPANKSGTLASGIRKRITPTEAEIGTTDMHGFYLREGTTRMAPRKMSDAALTEALPGIRSRMRPWAEWKR